MAIPALGVPTPLYATPQRAAVLPGVNVDVSQAALFTLAPRGATGTLTISAVQPGGGLTPQAYSQNADGSNPTTGAFTFTGSETLYCFSASQLVNITGTVTAGALVLVFTGFLVIPPGAAVPASLAQGGSLLNPLNALPVNVIET